MTTTTNELKFQEEVDDDPVETMLRKTGCLEKHYKVQECIAETKDWRKCQNEVHNFRVCMSKHHGIHGAKVDTKAKT